MEGDVPSNWKKATLKLLPKGSAQDDPELLSNFCLIALTPTVSKVLFGNRWLRHRREIHYLDHNIHKAFLPTVPGVSKHQAELASVIKSVKG